MGSLFVNREPVVLQPSVSGDSPSRLIYRRGAASNALVHDAARIQYHAFERGRNVPRRHRQVMWIFPSMTGELEAAAEAASQARPGSPILIAGHSHMRALIADINTADTVVHTVSESPHVLALHAPW